MKYYSIGEIEIIDPSWISEYVSNVTRQVEERGGRFLARTGKLEKIEGQRKVPQILVIVEWPSKESADAFYQSEEYRPYLEKRLAGGRNEFLLVAGEDVTKMAHIEE